MLPTDPRRWRLPLAGALLGALAALCYYLGAPQVPPDFVYGYTAAQALAHWHDPYEAVAALGRTPFWYPATAAVVLLPLVGFPMPLAHVAFGAASGAALGLAARSRPALAPAILGAPFVTAAATGQWSPLLAASAVLPALGWTWAVKPTLGLALLAGFPRRRAVEMAGAVTVLALLLWPLWPAEWPAAIHGSPHRPLVLRPFGWLLLAGLLRWRRPEARLLLVFACVPQLGVLYDAAPLALCARSKGEGYALAVLSWLAAFGAAWFTRLPDWVASAAAGWPVMLLLVYLPALALVLRQPNAR